MGEKTSRCRHLPEAACVSQGAENSLGLRQPLLLLWKENLNVQYWGRKKGLGHNRGAPSRTWVQGMQVLKGREREERRQGAGE